MDPDSATQTNTDRDPHSKYGTGFSNTIRIRLCIQNIDPDLSLKPIRIRTRIQNTDPDPQSWKQRKRLHFHEPAQHTVQCSYIIGSQRLNTPADQNNCFNCLSFTNNERRNADRKGITDGCCLVECSHTAPKKDKHNRYWVTHNLFFFMNNFTWRHVTKFIISTLPFYVGKTERGKIYIIQNVRKTFLCISHHLWFLGNFLCNCMQACMPLCSCANLIARVSDLHWFNADPDTDPAFFLIADPDSDPGSGSRVWWSKIEKNLQLEI